MAFLGMFDLFSQILNGVGASSLFDLEWNAALHGTVTGTAIGFDDFLDAITAKLVGHSATKAGAGACS